MEILKERNKPAVDVHAIRAKYQIDQEMPAQFKIQAEQSLVNIVQFEIDDLILEVEETDEVLEQSPDQIEVLCQSSKREPKLLNPTLLQQPKVQTRPKFQCDLCNYSSTTKASLTRHVVVHKRTSFKCKKIVKPNNGHQENKPKFKCHECKKHLSSQSALFTHQQTVHKQIKNFQCSSCPKAFATVSPFDR